MKNIDCLFVHPSLEIGKTPVYLVMPMGLLAIGDLLEREGFKCKIINTGLEKRLDSNFSLKEYLKRYNINVVGIDLHWYLHSHNAIKIAKIVKKNSNAKIVLGGFTASYFAREILQNFSFIDGIIRGEAEVPMVSFMNNFKNENYKDVPNLSYRKNRRLKENKIKYTAKKENLNKLNYSNLSLVKNWKFYIKESKKSWTGFYTESKKEPESIFFISPGRGCNQNCSFCSGSRSSYYKMFKRKKPTVRSPENITQELKELKEKYDVDSFHFEHNCFPLNKKFYKNLFSKIGKEFRNIGIHYSTCYPVTQKFLQEFSKIFDEEKSSISFRGGSASKQVRNFNRNFQYPNSSILKMAKNMEKNNLFGSFYFLFGLPRERKIDIEKTTKTSKYIMRNFGMNVKINTPSLEFASPMYENPEKFGIKKYRKRFSDFYLFSKKIEESQPVNHHIGYRTKFLSEDEIINWKRKLFRKIYLNKDFIFKRFSKFENIGDLKRDLKQFFKVLLGQEIKESF